MAGILVVEDDEQVRTLAVSILEEAGHETLSATSTSEAQTIIRSDAKFEVLFVDVTLLDDAGAGLEDRYAGLDLALAAASFRPGLRVVYTTGLGLKQGMSSLFVQPSEFLVKPYSREQLVRAVADVLNAPPPMNSQSY
jgi:CheY-like chemotaxis protein